MAISYGNIAKTLAAILISFTITGCSFIPAEKAAVINKPSEEIPITRKIETTPYTGNGGTIIFTVNHIYSGNYAEIVRDIIRVFGENNLPLDVSIALSDNTSNTNEYQLLKPYVDAGVIDLSIDGSAIKWLPYGTSSGSDTFNQSLSNLSNKRTLIKKQFGFEPVACYIQADEIREDNYRLIQAAGFKIICPDSTSGLNSSAVPVDWSDIPVGTGLCRLPVVTQVNYPAVKKTARAAVDAAELNSGIMKTIANNLDNQEVAIVELQPQNFILPDGKIDSAKMDFLRDLIKQCQQAGELTTFEGWYKYASVQIFPDTKSNHRILPVYKGGPAIIFRLDDVAQGYNEEVVRELIKLFAKNGVPLDLGVVSNADGEDSYKIPWIKEYVDEGAVGISVHGYDWTYYQLAVSKEALNAQIIDTGDVYNPTLGTQDNTTITYSYIKSKLRKARIQYQRYFGVDPVALTVPTDYFDAIGYQAVQDSGFKIFSTHISVEPHPSVTPVDYEGRKDNNGMYRIPTASDVSVWDQGSWGDVIDISQVAATKDYCKYYGAWEDMAYNEIGAETCALMGYIDVAAISLHPDAFIDATGNVDMAKIQKIEPIIKWVKTFATPTTFEQWYNYKTSKK